SQTLFEDQEDFAARVSSQRNLGRIAGRLKFKVDSFRQQQVAGKSAHTLNQILQVIFLRIDGPNDVTHRFNEFVRNTGDGLERLGRSAVSFHALLGHFAQNCDLRQRGSNVVVKIGGDAGAHFL